MNIQEIFEGKEKMESKLASKVKQENFLLIESITPSTNYYSRLYDIETFALSKDLTKILNKEDYFWEYKRITLCRPALHKEMEEKDYYPLVPCNSYYIPYIYIQLGEDKKSFAMYIYKVRIETSDDNNFDEWQKLKLEYVGIYNCGERPMFYKLLKKGYREVDGLKALNINSTSVYDNIIFEGYNNIWEFREDNKKLFGMLGLDEALKYSKLMNFKAERSLNDLFIKHIALLNKFPAIELLIKMGCSSLYFSIFSDCYNNPSQQEIIKKVGTLEKLIKRDETRGSMVLRIPSYIAQHLNYTNAELQEYLLWCDIYELSPMSKEQFIDLIESYHYTFFCLSFANMDSSYILPSFVTTVLKHGYTMKELCKYYFKAKEIDNVEVRHYWLDYLNMCDLLEITPNKFPQNLAAEHDRLSALLKAKEVELYDKKISDIANNVDTNIEHDSLTFIMPSSSKDLLEEGQQQHNCVASYANRIVKGQSIIFFIREKENVDKSYITAEYNPNFKSLGQVMYKNNQIVPRANKDYAFAEKVGQHIARALSKCTL